jgi:butyryl-CoA dehydrogenase
MLFELNEEKKLIRDTAREFAQETLSKYAKQIDREEKIPEEVIKKLAELGFWGIIVPEEFGGAGLDAFSLILVLEEISRVCASTSVTMSVHNSLVCNALVKYGTAEQKKKYLPRLAGGEIIGAYALTEPASGSDAASLTTRADSPRLGGAGKKGNQYVLNGTKIFITSAPIAGVSVVFARTNPDKSLRGKGISAFLVEPSFKGFKLGVIEEKMGVKGAIAGEIVLEDCAVPAGNLLGEENKGFNIAMELLDSGRIGIAAQSVGIAQACLDAAMKYSLERKQFGKTLSEFQAIQWKIADMATEINAARLLTYQAALLKDKNLPHIKEACMAKLFASTICNKAAKESIQVHGGMGYTKDFAVERFFRDAKVTEIYEGTSEVQRIVINKELFGKNWVSSRQ